MNPSMDLCITIQIEDLLKYVDPFNDDPWSLGEPVSVEAVEHALTEGRLRDHNPCWLDDAYTASQHAERIAYLIHHGWENHHPITIDIWDDGTVRVYDGNHRVYAMAFRRMCGYVTVSVMGFIDYIEEYFGIRIN